MKNITELMALLNGGVQNQYGNLQRAVSQPVDRSLLNPGQTAGDFFLRPTTDQNRTLLEASMAMLGSDPRAHPGKGISEGVRAGLALHDSFKERDKERSVMAAKLGLDQAKDARDFGLSYYNAIPDSQKGGGYGGTGIEAQHLNNWMRFKNGELPATDPRVQLARDFLSKERTVNTGQGIEIRPGYNLEGGGGGGARTVEKPLTEGERRAGYVNKTLATMNQEAESIIRNENGEIKFRPGLRDSLGNLAPQAVQGYIQSPEYRQYKAMADEWASMLVFLRSGATARQEEKDASFTNYWPQPGEDDATINAKRRMRQQMMENATALGRQQGRIDEAGNIVGLEAGTASGGAQPPTVTSQAEYDALPPGAVFVEDGKTYRKPLQ